MSAIIDDQRKEAGIPWAFVVATDRFLSGWGLAPRRSLFALECNGPKEAQTIIDNMKARSDMKRPRIVGIVYRKGMKRYMPRVRIFSGDHLSIRERAECPRFYTAGGFSK